MATATAVRTTVFGRHETTAYQALVWALMVLLVLGPLAPIVYSSLLSKPFYLPGAVFTLNAYASLFADPAYWVAVRNSIQFAALVTAIAVPAGTLFAILCHRTDLPLAKWFALLLMAPIVIPHLGLIVGWVVLYGEGGYLNQIVSSVLHLPPWRLSSVGGMALLGAAVTTPIAYLTCRAALEGKDTALEDAARSLGAGPLSVITRVTIPMLRPAILNCGVLIFALGLEVLGIPLLLGAPSNIDMYASYLFKAWSKGPTPNPPMVSAGSVVLLLVVTVLLLMRAALSGSQSRFVASGPRGGGTFRPLALGAWRYPFAAATGAFIAVTSIVPLLGLVVMSSVSALTILVPPWDLLTLDNWRQILFDVVYRRAIANSLVIAVVGAGLTVLLVAVASLIAHRSRFPLRASLGPTLVYPRAVPGIVLGLGFFWIFLLVDLPGGAIRNSIWSEMIALSVRNSTLAYVVIYPSLVRINVAFDNAARGAGAGWWMTVRRVLLPMLRPALVAAFVLMFISILNDYDPVVFLQKPGTEVMGVTLLQFWMRGVVGSVAALAVVQLALVGIILALTARVLRRALRA